MAHPGHPTVAGAERARVIERPGHHITLRFRLPAAWERLALITAILVPPVCLLVLIGFMAVEGEYTWLTRLAQFVQLAPETFEGHHH